MYEKKVNENGFEYIEIKNSVASAKIALQGAHIFSFKRSDSQELLWVSAASAFEYGKAIRGGIPLCWPRFGNLDKSMPQHGFARTALFELLHVDESDAALTIVTMLLKSSQESKKIWNYDFELKIVFSIAQNLQIEMISKNRDTREFRVTEALHTYFAVSDILKVEISGLQGCPYLDTLRDKEEVQEGALRIAQEVDRIYKQCRDKIILHDGEKSVKIVSENTASVIVWNPWHEKAAKMSAMEENGYKRFVCIESGNALDDFRRIGKDQSSSMCVKYFT
jgi:glucose-6-phosphate 1-epimerase